MEQEDLKLIAEALAKGGIKGNFVMEKHVEYEVNNVESGGIGIQINGGNRQAFTDKATEVPACLTTEDAEKYWRRLRKQHFVDADHHLLPSTTRKEAMYMAELFAEKLKLKAKWKPFQALWSINNLAQEKWDMQQTGVTPARHKDIERIFED